MMNSSNVKLIEECFIRPKTEIYESKREHYLGPMDLVMLSSQYLQTGLLFNKPSYLTNLQEYSTLKFLDSLKTSLALTLVHFYPLAGRLSTRIVEDRHESLVFVDCLKGPGAKFIHATLDMTISDVITESGDVPSVVYTFFDHNECVNHDGHDRSLLTVKVTELLDGVFIACSMNHSVVDGTSFWQFWKIWSEIHTTITLTTTSYSQTHLESLDILPTTPLPIYQRWLPDGYDPTITLPYTKPEEYITRYEETNFIEKVFHFSSASISKLKAKARKESENDNISSLQALTAHLWMSLVRAKSPIDHDRLLSCSLLANDRCRLNPPLLVYYFGNFISLATSEARAGDLLEKNLGWAASLLYNSVENHDDKAIRDFITDLRKSPVFQPVETFDGYSVYITHSPRFDMYGNEFGLGKAVAVRSGYSYKFDGIVEAYPGCEGGGSVDFLICLPFDTMRALESVEEFNL